MYYNITIYDLYGNGFGGTVTIVDQQLQQRQDNNAILVKEPGFSQVSGTSVTHGFYVESANNNPPYPSNYYQYLTLKFDFDMFAHEVAYEIKNDYDNVIFALAWFQTYEANTPNAKIRIPIYGSEKGDQTYTLRIWDSGNDGICCSWGNGGYELYLGDPDDTTGGFLLKRGSGDYGSKETFQFLIEGDELTPTSTPTIVSSTYVPTSKSPTLTPVAVKLDASSVDTTLSPTIDYSFEEETYIFEASSVAIPRPAYVDGTKPASNDIKFGGDGTEEAQPSVVLSTNDDTENDGGIIFAPESNVDDTLSSTGMSSRKKNLVGGHAIVMTVAIVIFSSWV